MRRACHGLGLRSRANVSEWTSETRWPGRLLTSSLLIVEVTVPSLAKINLDLRVLHKRNDGYHELRSLFQAISLKDTINIQFESARRSELALESSVDIPDNLVLRAARLICDELNIKARVLLRL